MLGCFDSLEAWIAALGLVFLAEAVYVALGFGAGMIALGGLVFLMGDPRDAVVVLMLITAPVQIWVVVRRFNGKLTIPRPWLALGAVVGVPVGTYALHSLSSRGLLLILGSILVFATVVLGASKPSPEPRTQPVLEPLVGLVSGTLSGAFGAGGSPLILYLQWAGLDRSSFRLTMMSVFLVSSVARVPTYAWAGLFTWPRAWTAVMLAPAIAAGIVVGQRLHTRMNEAVFRKVVLSGLATIGLTLLVRNV